MASAAVDHMLALTIFIAAILIFIGFFSQNMQTAISYQEHNAMSTKTSDLLDTMLLTTGLPAYWGQDDTDPTGFGLQNPDASQYKLSPYAPMRLSTASEPVFYAAKNCYYNNLTAQQGSYLLTPIDDGDIKSVTYQEAARMLGINGTYGFHLSLTPTVEVSVQKTSSSGPLQLAVNGWGRGFVLANANVTCSVIAVNQDASDTPSYTVYSQNGVTDSAGMLELSFPEIDGETQAYAAIAYTYLYGLKGVGYYVRSLSSETVVPIIDSFQNYTIRIAHSGTVGDATSSASELHYNTSYALVTEEYTLRQIQLDHQNATGTIYGDGDPSGTFKTLTLPISDSGILIVAYKDTTSDQYGIQLVPWGLGSLALPMEFGGNSAGHDWITTDIRQVTISDIAYHAKLELWLLHGGA